MTMDPSRCLHRIRPPARIVDLPEVLALRALLMDRRVAFDTVERWIPRPDPEHANAGLRAPPWSGPADHVASRLVQIGSGGEGSMWSTLEVVRELWDWHPDDPYIAVQSERLLHWLELLLAAPQSGSSPS